MKKGNVVKEIIGGVLFPLGFELKYDDGWEFRRVVKNSHGEDIKQWIAVRLHRFAPEVFLDVNTNAYGWTTKRMDNFVPRNLWHPKSLFGDKIAFSDDESFKDAISYMAGKIKEYGLEKLAEMTEPTTNDRFLRHEHIDVYENHELIYANFIKHHNISEEIDIEVAAKIVYDGIMRLKGKPFQEIKGELFNLGVFYASRLDKMFCAEWILHDKATFINYKRGDVLENFPPLSGMKWCWDRDTPEEIMARLDELRKPVYYNVRADRP